MTLTIIQVDAFTNRPFSGNPAAVCVTDSPLEDDLMQAIAAEMNLSETAFLYPLKGEPVDGGYSLRWFTPATEVDLCGHATLASAHVLWEEGYLSPDEPARFQTKSGWLGAKQTQKGTDTWIEMDFPAQPVETTYVMPALIKALCCGGNIRSVAKNETNYLVEIQSEKALRSLQPDFDAVAKLPTQGLIATAVAEGESYDFASRYFAPSVGINEDPVTGSAHSSLAPFWREKLGKTTMLAQQVSERGGVLHVQCMENDRVLISGQAVTVLKAELIG
ncbi:MAG: PhzF family phenazine biosynthesis protein [Cyanobacteria bacterium J06632_3]